MTTKANKFFSLAVLAVLFAYVYWFSTNVLWLGDDIYYRFVVGSFPSRPIMAFADVVESQIAHYHVENGRVEAHFLVQLILSFFPKWLFALLNAVAYTVFVTLMVKIGLKLRIDSGDDKVMSHPKALLFATIMTLTCIFLKFVPTTAMYIWMYDLMMAYLYVLLFCCPKSLLMTIPLALFSFLAGAAHESLSMGLVVGLFIYGLQRLRRLTANEAVMMLMFALGFLTIAFAPSTGERMRQFSASALIVVWSAVYLKATIILIMLLITGGIHMTLSLRDFYHRYSFWVNSMLAIIIFVYVVIGIGGPRPLLGIEVISIILTVAIWHEVRVGRWVVATGMVAFSAMLLYKTTRDVKAVGDGVIAYESLSNDFMSSRDGTIVKEFSLSSYASRLDEYLLPGVVENLRSTDEVTDAYFISTLSDRLNLEHGTRKRLRILPPIALSLSEMPDSSQLVKAAEGVYYIIVSKVHEPRQVTIHRSLGPIRWSDFIAYPTDEAPIVETPRFSLYPVYAERHIVDVDSVTIER